VEEGARDKIPALSPWTGRTNDRFAWATNFKRFENLYGTPSLGGKHYSIHMSKAQRKQASFDTKDPFAGMSAKDLKDLQSGKKQILIR
jgi:hypothetical protein